MAEINKQVPRRAAAAKNGARLTYLITTVSHAIRARKIEPALKQHDVSGLQFSILSVVHRREGLSSANLSRRFYVSPQTMGQVLNGLESRGLLERKEDPANRRVLLVTLTDTGRAVVEKCELEMNRIEADVFAGMDAADQASLRKVMTALATRLREE